MEQVSTKRCCSAQRLFSGTLLLLMYLLEQLCISFNAQLNVGKCTQQGLVSLELAVKHDSAL